MRRSVLQLGNNIWTAGQFVLAHIWQVGITVAVLAKCFVCITVVHFNCYINSVLSKLLNKGYCVHSRDLPIFCSSVCVDDNTRDGRY